MRMAGLKEERRRAIEKLIRTHELASQEEVAEQLSRLGFDVTQATVSRDLEQIGAVKVRRSGHLSYALPGEVQAAPEPRLAALLRDFARSVETAGNLVVVKTPPGSAHLIGVALDQSRLDEIVGTICGDDTIFVACKSTNLASELADKLSSETSKLQ